MKLTELLQNSVINSIMLLFIASFIVGISGFFDKMSNLVFKMVTGRENTKGWSLPLFTCPLCATFWSVLFYNIYIGNAIIYSLFIASLLAYLSRFIVKLLFYFIRL
jgi:hypothetical protein